jgi:hypothetical protein
MIRIVDSAVTIQASSESAPCPIDACKPHRQLLRVLRRFLVRREGPFTAALAARLSNDSLPRNR